MSAKPKHSSENTQTLTQTRSSGDLTQVGGFGTEDLFDTRKFELVPVLNFVSGPEKGRVIAFKERMVVGRSRSCSIPISDASCSRQHAAFDFIDNKFYVEDLKSTNGVRVNGTRILNTYEIKEGDRVQLGDLTIIRFGFMPQAEASIQQDVYMRATRDGLTGVFNRKSFDEALEREVAYCQRHKKGLGLIIFDLDHFKKINDTHGHPAGDEVLRRTAETVQKLVRTEDLFARIGGEEFALLTRNESSESLRALGERVRAQIESVTVNFEQLTINVTVSVGVAFMDASEEALDKAVLFNRADNALYDAKKAGRNRVVLAEKKA